MRAGFPPGPCPERWRVEVGIVWVRPRLSLYSAGTLKRFILGVPAGLIAAAAGHAKMMAAALTNRMTLAQAAKNLAFPAADNEIKSVRLVSSHHTLTVRVQVSDLHKMTEANGLDTVPGFVFFSNGNDTVTTEVFVGANDQALAFGVPKGGHVSVVRGINGSVTLTIPRTDFPAKDKTERIQVGTETHLEKPGSTYFASWGSLMPAPYKLGVFVDTH